MNYQIFSPDSFDTYRIAFLVPDRGTTPDLSEKEIRKCYLDPHLPGAEEQVIAYNLIKGPKKTPVVIQKEYLATQLLPTLRELEVEYLVVCDSEYFKTLTKGQGAEANLGYVLASDGEYKDENKEVHSFQGFKVVYCPNYRGIFRDEVRTVAGIEQALTALRNHIEGEYVRPGSDIIHYEAFPKTPDEIQEWLDKLLEMDCDLTSDIEAFSLKHYDAGIGTITFCWNQHEGIAFGVDLEEGPDGMPIDRPVTDSQNIRAMLKDFFIRYSRTGHRMKWHNIGYDGTVLIFQLFMTDILDRKGLLTGLDIMLPGNNWDDTKHITYLATNSCAGNKLGLKDQSQEYAGKYAEDEIKNIRKIPFQRLLTYNLIDGLCTWYVFNKHWPTVLADDQLRVYEGLFQPSTRDIIDMQLTGMPMDMERVIQLDHDAREFAAEAETAIRSNPLVDDYLLQKRLAFIEKENKKLKTKQRTMEEAKTKVDFNLGSPDDLKALLYGKDFMELPVLDLTDSGEPATGGDTLKKLKNHTDREDVIEFLDALIDYKQVAKLIESFIPKFLAAKEGPDGWHYLFGNFNLGGTVSGRLSSSGPNLQNLPSNDPKGAKVKWAKRVKDCFRAPPGYLFIGLDFASLEDRISALQTKDPQKLKVYTDGYDGHSLRAHAYFGDQMSDNIDPEDVESINSIADIHPDLRQDSKTPTFALTYAGTFHAIMNQCGWPKEKAQAVEAKFKELYKVSIKWVADKVERATKDGYVTVAFGLRVRTPILGKTVLNTKSTPYEAAQEARTVGNALGQSYCMLNSRAANEFNGKARSSKYSQDIRPCAHIHDAQYFIIPEDPDVLLYVNEHLVQAVEWQDDPEIYHDEVKLGGEVGVFFPSWAEEMVIPNGATKEDLKDLAQKHMVKYGLI